MPENEPLTLLLVVNHIADRPTLQTTIFQEVYLSFKTKAIHVNILFRVHI